MKHAAAAGCGATRAPSRRQTKSLRGIETVYTSCRTRSILRCRRQTKSLRGIETREFRNANTRGRHGRRQTKSLTGIETCNSPLVRALGPRQRQTNIFVKRKQSIAVITRRLPDKRCLRIFRPVELQVPRASSEARSTLRNSASISPVRRRSERAKSRHWDA